MGDISKHFNRSEFACKCGCGFDTVDIETLEVLEEVRTYFDKPVSINSACRCPDHNFKVGGSENSQHVKGRAADIVVAGIDPREVYSLLDRLYPDWFGLGSYDSFTHVDTRSNKARW